MTDNAVLGNIIVVLRDVKNSSLLCEGAIEQLREFIYDMGAKSEIHITEMVLDALYNMGLLHHAAAETDNEIWVCLLVFLEPAHIAKDTVLGVFPHRTGVEENEVGLGRVVCELIPHFREDTVYFLPICHISLAAIGMGKAFGDLPPVRSNSSCLTRVAYSNCRLSSSLETAMECTPFTGNDL